MVRRALRVVSRPLSDWSLDVRIAPDGARSRLAGAMNQRPKRALGVLKVGDEFIGGVHGDRFEVWERRKRAVHAVGTLMGIEGGTRVAVRFVVPMVTRVLIVIFFVLYAAVAVGIATRSPDPALTGEEIAIAVAGGIVVAGVFFAGARSQQGALRSFIEDRFRDVPKL